MWTVTGIENSFYLSACLLFLLLLPSFCAASDGRNKESQQNKKKIRQNKASRQSRNKQNGHDFPISEMNILLALCSLR